MTRLIPDWEIRITTFGLGYVLMCLVVAIGATNTGNNGLYLVLAGMLSSMVVSGVISRRNVRGVACEIEPVGEVVAGRPALLKVRFENRLATATAQALFFLHEGLPGPLWVDPLKPGERREVLLEGIFPSRGVFRDADAGLLSRFPLGLFRKYRRARFAREVVVYPAPEPSPVPAVPPEDSRGGEVGLVSRSVLVAASAGRGQRARILEALARLAPVAAAGAPAFPPLRHGDLRWYVS